MLYIGLDLHKIFSYVTIMNDRGEVISPVGEAYELTRELLIDPILSEV